MGKTAIKEFQKFLTMKVIENDTVKNDNGTFKYSPSQVVDAVWHTTLMMPEFYKRIVASLGVPSVDHDPLQSLDPPIKKARRYAETLNEMETMYRGGLNSSMWPEPVLPAESYEDKTLEECNVSRNDTLHLILKLSGC